MIRKALVGVLLAVTGLSPLRAQETKPCTVNESETPSAAFLRCSEEVRQREAEQAKKQVKKELETVQEGAKGKVSAQASSAAATDASGSRVSDSLTDLLPFFQGAITPANTAGDGTPVVLNFNSPPFLRGKTSLQATLVEPKIFPMLAEKFPAAVRDAETKRLLDRAGGFGDPTYSLGWSPVRRAGNWSTRRQLFGREMKTYLPLINEYAEVMTEDLLPRFTEKVSTLLKQARQRLVHEVNHLGPLVGLTFDQIMNETTFAKLRDEARTKAAGSQAEALIAGIAAEIGALSQLEGEAQAILDEKEQEALERKFAYLVGNQPVLQVRTSYRDADPAVGPRDYAVTVEYSAGTLNFNALLEDYRALIEQRPDTSDEIGPEERIALKRAAFEDITSRAVNGDLWRSSYALTYKKISDYDESFDYQIDGVEQAPAALSVPGVEQLQVRLNFSHLAGPALFTDDVRPRIEYSIDGTWILDDEDVPEDMRRQDRVLGRVTYTVPTTDNLTFPVSIVFANRPEFLAEDKDLRNQLSAHVGLSYKVGAKPKKPE